jgi:outer membrane lipoprotein carrier protein
MGFNLKSMRFHRTAAILAATVLLGLLRATPLSYAQRDVHALAEKVDRHYNNMQTLQADFTEIYKGAGLSRTESGTLWLKRPGRMRWQYDQPRKKLFVADGKTAWFYANGDQMAQKVQVKNLDDLRTPLAYLLGRTKLEKEFEGLSLAPDQPPVNGGKVVLRGVPKNMKQRVSQVLLEVNADGALTRIMAEEVDGSTTDFRFTNQHENVPFSADKFKFKPPPGVQVEETKTTQF